MGWRAEERDNCPKNIGRKSRPLLEEKSGHRDEKNTSTREKRRPWASPKKLSAGNRETKIRSSYLEGKGVQDREESTAE